MCTPVDENKLTGYDSKTNCVIINGIATRYISEPESILKEVKDNGFKIIHWNVELKKNEPTGILFIEAIKPMV